MNLSLLSAFTSINFIDINEKIHFNFKKKRKLNITFLIDVSRWLSDVPKMTAILSPQIMEEYISGLIGGKKTLRKLSIKSLVVCFRQNLILCCY